MPYRSQRKASNAIKEQEPRIGLVMKGPGERQIGRSRMCYATFDHYVTIQPSARGASSYPERQHSRGYFQEGYR